MSVARGVFRIPQKPADYVIYKPTSHARKVRALYKDAIRNIESHCMDSVNHYWRLEARYQSVLMRQRFDENSNVLDMRKAKKLLLEGQKELAVKCHPDVFRFPEAPGGVAYERYRPKNDKVLDLWTPLEKAQYPEYFALREIRKREFIERWEKKYGKWDPTEKDPHDAVY